MVFEPLNLAVASAALSALAYVPYAVAILRGTARPHRASWLIWSALSALAFAAVWSADGTKSLLFAGTQTAGTLIVFALSLWRGTGSFASRTEVGVLTAACLGLVIWALTDAPAWAMGLSIAIGAAGGSLTVLKAYQHPQSEALMPWSIQVLAAALGVGSVAGGTSLEVAYPLYLFCLYVTIWGAVIFGRSRSVLPAGSDLV